jgi:hypothetical protein
MKIDGAVTESAKVGKSGSPSKKGTAGVGASGKTGTVGGVDASRKAGTVGGAGAGGKSGTLKSGTAGGASVFSQGFIDKTGSVMSSRGYRVDKDGNILDNQGRKKFDKTQTTPDGDLPKLFNYNGRRFDIVDTIGQLDKDANGNIMPNTDQNGNLVDNLGRRVNSRGYLIDEFGNVIDKDGR